MNGIFINKIISVYYWQEILNIVLYEIFPKTAITVLSFNRLDSTKYLHSVYHSAFADKISMKHAYTLCEQYTSEQNEGSGSKFLEYYWLWYI